MTMHISKTMKAREYELRTKNGVPVFKESKDSCTLIRKYEISRPIRYTPSLQPSLKRRRAYKEKWRTIAQDSLGEKCVWVYVSSYEYMLFGIS